MTGRGDFPFGAWLKDEAGTRTTSLGLFLEEHNGLVCFGMLWGCFQILVSILYLHYR